MGGEMLYINMQTDLNGSLSLSLVISRQETVNQTLRTVQEREEISFSNARQDFLLTAIDVTVLLLSPTLKPPYSKAWQYLQDDHGWYPWQTKICLSIRWKLSLCSRTPRDLWGGFHSFCKRSSLKHTKISPGVEFSPPWCRLFQGQIASSNVPPLMCDPLPYSGQRWTQIPRLSAERKLQLRLKPSLQGKPIYSDLPMRLISLVRQSHPSQQCCNCLAYPVEEHGNSPQSSNWWKCK